MITTLKTISARLPRELKLFLVASFAVGMAASLVDAIFNNFLNDRFALSGFQRSFLEFPREFAGVLVVFVSAGLSFLCSRRLGAVALLLAAVGALLLGFASPFYAVMLAWLFLYSLGQHLFMPLASTIGMELAREGETGRRLGQLNAVRNFSAIVGSFAVVLGFRYLGLGFRSTFAIAAVLFAVTAALLFAMQPQKTHLPGLYLKLHRAYRLYYLLAILYGSRKQIFLTFAPWVLVTVFDQPTHVLAALYTVGGVLGIFFQPLLGWATDRLGERFVLTTEAFLMIFVCAGYGFAKFLLPPGAALYAIYVCFLLDQMLLSVNMARSMYMKKIALHPDHVQPALTVSITIDHVFSISVALVGGVIWSRLGFQYVFLLGSVIAVGNLLAALKVRTPAGTQESQTAAK